ncbi:membrane protein insertase YidC [Congregibacter litoralis]|uniref:Membrane protein insertase YidC n=1 Tax=Congregibacter litoralis KT71 TaxID=314285 RepID=A4A960_9GAMM|nr:membrane protein insertase YidC [Congregibacter litoralis]EAQ97602.1 protein translocase subunit yidC [Congregibacter litoralis KT71]
MDIQRTLLIGAIMLLSFMLLTEWVNFKAVKDDVISTETRLTAGPDTQSSNKPITGMTDTGDLPSAAAAPAVAEPTIGIEDIPAVGAAVDTSTEDTGSGSGNNGNIIQVYTDSLQLAIDLKGGDIVEVALPKFLADIDDPDTPFVLLENNSRRVYVAQSGLIGKNGIDSKARANYQSTASRYEMGAADTLEVDLTWSNDAGIEVTKRFRFLRDSYVVDVDFIINNQSSEAWQGNLFGQIKRDSSAADSGGGGSMGMQPFLGAATTMPDDRFKKFSFEDMQDDPFREQNIGGWIAMIQHYFLSAWIPNPEKTHTYSTRVTNSGFNIAGFTSPAVVVAPGAQQEVSARFYAGPKDQYSLQEISPFLELSVDYGWLWWVAQPLFWLLTKIFAVVGNWGVAIILLTVLIKAVFFKLSATSYKSMANMRRVQPKMADIREQYADDKQKQSQAMMELYKKEKINPMGGCLPILVQMPVFIALYWMLMESVELRHAPFMLWIDDLSVMDPYFVLPLMMGASMFFMQKLNPPPPDPMQAKIMQWLPVIFTFFFLWFPAGLVLYWVVNNLLSMAQQYVITRQIENAGAKA